MLCFLSLFTRGLAAAIALGPRRSKDKSGAIILGGVLAGIIFLVGVAALILFACIPGNFVEVKNKGKKQHHKPNKVHILQVRNPDRGDSSRE